MADGTNNGFIYRVGSTTTNLGRPPHFYRSDVLRQKGCKFASVYAVREEDAKAITEAGTAQGFKGIVWSQRLWVDFDDKDASAQAREFLIKEQYDFVEYDTGNRGSHFGIMRECVPSHLLPSSDRLWVERCLEGADLSLYWHLHLLRLPGVLHEKTGKPKREVYRQQGSSIQWASLSNQVEKVRASTMGVDSTGRSSIFSHWSVVSNLTRTEGIGRHEQLLNLCLALKKDAKVTEEEALWVVQEVNRGFEEPKGDEEVSGLVKWAYEGT